MEERIDILLEVGRIVDDSKQLSDRVTDREVLEKEIDIIVTELKLSNSRIDRNQTEIDNLKAETKKLITNLKATIE